MIRFVITSQRWKKHKIGSIATCACCELDQTIEAIQVYDGGLGFELSCGHRNGYCHKCEVLLKDTGSEPDTIASFCPSCSVGIEPESSNHRGGHTDKNPKRYANGILYAVTCGFLLLIACLWLIEGTSLFGNNDIETVEVSINTGLVLAVAIPVLVIVKRMLTQLNHLERFITVCSWCKKVNYNGRWISHDIFMKIRFKTETSHGLCPDCSDKIANEVRSRKM